MLSPESQEGAVTSCIVLGGRPGRVKAQGGQARGPCSPHPRQTRLATGRAGCQCGSGVQRDLAVVVLWFRRQGGPAAPGCRRPTLGLPRRALQLSDQRLGLRGSSVSFAPTGVDAKGNDRA